jgi:hypothetical protein
MKLFTSALTAVLLLSTTLAFAGPVPAKSFRCIDTETNGALLAFDVASTAKFFAERTSQETTWIDLNFNFAGKTIETSLFQPWVSQMGLNGSSEKADFYQAAQPKGFNWACNWKKCPIQNVSFNVVSTADHVAKGSVKFMYSPNENAGFTVEHNYAVSCSY